ncbi:DUF1761 domain-containing protein [Sessilibacter corallicola]|uniref:DUF1761 domain-containing protein n=1 Tax=Sessilibacter corallicola TaxID=2904075 RepID=UPI001E2BD0A9|nr:DUF1761 domain-containing protein [Sessilibacter corallicola]MCE2029103.1 DUF1761 domain-containing protein [Sessilibacter corallicola]
MFDINILEIVAGAVVGMMLGALWYSPLLFGNLWMKAIGKTPETLGSSTGPMIGSMVASLLSAIGVALLSSLIDVQSLGQAITLGLILGFLIIFPAFLSDSLFCGWGTQLLLIQSGYRMLSVFLMSVVIYFV